MRSWFLSVLMFTLMSGSLMAAEKKIVYGYVEKALLVDKNLTVSAKLDTGAKSASLSAINIQPIIKDGKQYLQFTVPSKQGNVDFIAEYLGKVRIKVRAGEHLAGKLEPIRRPVVLMRIRMGNVEQQIPVNLTNRKRFIYPLLLGRDAINAFSGLVDPSSAFRIKMGK
ncbi:hypothetical protein B1207_04800 [Legionella quinlivanii]|uniref:Retropepsin-like aspartic endopeptidase domain-containing protein n=1 Tax=Legionella quinlivanii TaxID=45073 RepID=A0A364LLC5_9GAMM|nr:RimK/LysX family protein [Legionella quinlivanii]RAP37496.1 hypothetical protein B1207_04800 [Legionella quinlivanii]